MSDALEEIERLLTDERDPLLDAWVAAQLGATTIRTDLLSENELRVESARFLDGLRAALAADRGSADITSSAWDALRDQLNQLSRTRASQGFSPSETATFVFSLKEPLFTRLQDRVSGNGVGPALWQVTTLLDELGLLTAEAFLRSREEVIRRQQEELIELSTPVVKLWEGVVALPLIGTLDSARTQVVMESLLDEIVRTDSTIAILDITGVPTVDTLVAQHLLKTVAAARLMGADCIISGIRPQIAQTVVHLGLDLSDVTTKASLADALTVALERTGYSVTRRRSSVAE
jgi:rsbT co-antagonist protein RsbR